MICGRQVESDDIRGGRKSRTMGLCVPGRTATERYQDRSNLGIFYEGFKSVLSLLRRHAPINTGIKDLDIVECSSNNL